MADRCCPTVGILWSLCPGRGVSSNRDLTQRLLAVSILQVRGWGKQSSLLTRAGAQLAASSPSEQRGSPRVIWGTSCVLKHLQTGPTQVFGSALKTATFWEVRDWDSQRKVGNEEDINESLGINIKQEGVWYSEGVHVCVALLCQN